MLADVGLKFDDREEMQIIRWMCGVSMKYISSSEKLKLVAVELITTVIRGGRLRHGSHRRLTLKFPDFP